ncbi:MAG TPA: hypothetical protein VGO13_03520 [Solirubrobacterales bacterium]|nr:hypothetical protein [Solirubrobacterales bacterium]
MIELTDTWTTVVMLLVAAGVGLIGGAGAAFIEWRSRCALPADPDASCGKPWTVVSCVALGGIAAVAALYFFPPTTEVVETGKEPATRTFYDLIRLVALSLIIGSAGSAFLQAFQARAMSAVNQLRATTAESERDTVIAVARETPELARTGIEAAAPQIQETLRGVGLKTKKVNEVIGQLTDQASAAVEQGIRPYVEMVGSNPSQGSNSDF